MLPARLAALWILADSDRQMWSGEIEDAASKEFGRIATGTVNFLKENGFIDHHQQYRGGMGTYTVSEKGRDELHSALNRAIKAALIMARET